jgi:hypothetical protein
MSQPLPPIPVIPLDYAKPAEAGRRRYLRVAEIVSITACVIAWAFLTFVDVESVLVSGPVLFLLGAALFVGGLVHRDRRSVVFGAAHASVCLLFVGLVNLFGWGPSEAKHPFALLGGIYAMGLVGIIVGMEMDPQRRAGALTR